jgi:hypothetical protein
MPINYSIDTDKGVVYTTASDVLTEDELFEHKRKLVSDPEFKPGFVELSDVRFITELRVSADDIQRFVMQDRSEAEQLQDFKLAIIVSGSTEFGLGIMYETMSSESSANVRIFRDMGQAREWLGIS